MKYLSLLGLAAMAAASPAAMPDAMFNDFDLAPTPVAKVVARATSSQKCIKSGVHLMIAAGCKVPCASDVPSLLQPLVDDTKQRIPGSDYYAVPYTNSSNNQIGISTPMMIQAVKDYHAACPNVPIAFLGYSLGGIIIMNTLCDGLPGSYSGFPVISAIVYGEETYRANEPYNYGTCQNNAPNYPRGNVQGCLNFTPVLHSYCNTPDPQCCSGGTQQSQHFSYPSSYDHQAFTFMLNQYSSFTSSTNAVAATAIGIKTDSAATPSSKSAASTSVPTSTSVSAKSSTKSTSTSTITSVSSHAHHKKHRKHTSEA